MLLFVDHLTNVDFSFVDPSRGLLGETWLANVKLHGELDDQGMVCDFGVVKKLLRQWLDSELDHRLAVPDRSPHITLREDGDSLDIRWEFGDSGEFLHTRAPRSAVAIVDAEILTPETVAAWCSQQIKQLLPDSVARLELDFTCEEIEGAYYHYSHGLKKHAGNCQRIAHGHRSRIDIWAGGRKSAELEREWAKRWRDIYIGTREDIVDTPAYHGESYYHFAYRSAQGNFELTLPQRCCYLIDTDSTVEFLAWHIAQRTRAEHRQHMIRDKAFEGVEKLGHRHTGRG
jgi:6-pyruvoyl-tetrahydropterin synthase